jgi:predicted amidophosphoribosyltransferase
LRGHALSRLILDAKRNPDRDSAIAAIFGSLAELVTARARPQLIVSVPPAPGDARDRFAAARAELAAFYGARDGGDDLRMVRAVAFYKRAPRDARAKLNVERFAVAGSLSGERALLIDDVLTSGGQSEACRAALLTAGCGSVTVIALAVTQDKLPDSCPECGSSLVKRIRRKDRSPFLGCTRYPSCHYTRSLSSQRGLSR